jgi:cytochrome c oxidase cbb3-type subunit 3
MLCATCHGEDGCTPGPGAAGLDPQPAHHCDGNYMNALSDEHIFKVIKEGGASVGKSPLMAPWGGTLSDDQIHDVVAFVRSLAKPPYPGHPTK